VDTPFGDINSIDSDKDNYYYFFLMET
jgi:hypothetical protein